MAAADAGPPPVSVRPATYDLIVIGSGPAGEKGAVQAAYFGKKVALVEQAARFGGAVANTGVPGKAMRETALYLSGFRQRDLNGLNLAYDGTLTIDRFMHRGRAVRHALDHWIGTNLERHRVDVHRGRATFVDPYTVAVDGEAGPTLLEAGVVLIATGSTPRRPPTVPFDGSYQHRPPPSGVWKSSAYDIHTRPSGVTASGATKLPGNGQPRS